jgi:uncharacterized protein
MNKALSQTIRQKHVPQRSCVACRGKKNKRDLIRLVYNADIVQVDPGGKKAGRGSYLCSEFECWDLGLQQKRLDHALHIKISPENRQVLLEYARSLPKREDA